MKEKGKKKKQEQNYVFYVYIVNLYQLKALCNIYRQDCVTSAFGLG